MFTRSAAILAVWAAAATWAWGQAPGGPPPPTQPATPARVAAPTPAPVPPTDPAVVAMLDQMEAAGKQFTSLQAQVVYLLEEPIIEDLARNTGQVYYQKDPTGARPAQFRIHFDTRQEGANGPRVRDDTDYAFDGMYFITRKARIKQMVKYQVGEPGKPPVGALTLGKGPFPIPFGQERSQVLRMFTVTTRGPQAGNPPNSRYLLMVPRTDSPDQVRLQKLEMWIGRDGLPVRIKTVDLKGENVTTVDFANIQKYPTLGREVFQLPAPPRDWDYQFKPLERASEDVRP